MTIRNRIDEGNELWKSGRREGALLSICAAISATSIKRYPSNKFGDSQAFQMFLDDELIVATRNVKRIFMLVPGTADYCRYSSIVAKNPNADERITQQFYWSFQRVIYKFVRCSLSHEGALPRHIEFSDNQAFSLSVSDTTLTFGGAVVDGMMRLVMFAPENLDVFPEYAGLDNSTIGEILFPELNELNTAYLSEREQRVRKLISAKSKRLP